MPEAELFKALLDAAPDAIIAVDACGRIVLVNAQADVLFGYDRQVLVGEQLELLVPDAARPSHPGHRQSYFAQPATRPMGAGIPLAGRRKDGTEFPAEISLSSIDTGDGVLVCAAVRDATDRQRAEAKFRALLEAAPDAIVGIGSDGRIALVNAQTEALFGYVREELIGQPVEILVPDSVRDLHPHLRDRYMADPFPRPMGGGAELAGRRKDGTEFPAEISLSSIETEDGLLVSAAIRDVSDRKRAEAKFRGLLEAAPDAIVGVDVSGRITLLNAQAERLFGYTREELLGELIETLVPDHAKDVHPTTRAAYFEDPRPRPMGAGMDLMGRRKDGTEFPAEISLSALDTEEGRIVSAAIRDATERIEAQAERERLKAEAERERLESATHQSQRLESLGQLAGGVAHDFNNLLAVILNYTTFINEEVTTAATEPDGERWEAVRQDVEQVHLATERAIQLTHQLLTFGRRDVVRPQALSLNEVVKGIEQLLRRTIGEHVQLGIQADPDLASVMADRGQIEQVLVNLAVNARDAMPRGGGLSIETRNIQVDDDYAAVSGPDVSPGQYVRLRVSDTGAGMERAVLERVFEPFFTTKPKGEGSGLGLATVYGIINQAGGSVQIYSEPGVGTTVTALLPASDASPAAIERATVDTRAHGGETVLVVEDEDALREVTRRILARNGHTVLAASTGADAIRMTEEYDGEIHLLLTDVVMPQMLGKEVAERVRAIRSDLPVLFMSGYAQGVLASQGTMEASVTLLEKPFTEASLLAMVRDVLDAQVRL
jgi:PAS domain S-box-containing protein